MPEDSESRANIQPPNRLWRPFVDLNWLAGGISLKAEGPMSWSGHDPETVIANRTRYLAAQGLDIKKAVGTEQVHERRIYLATHADAGRGMDSSSTRILATDALMTREAGLILTTLHADCAPIFIADPEHRAIALAHAGWRGVILHLPREVIRRMSAEFGSVPQKLRIAVGPTISGEHYPVGAEIAEKFTREFGHDSVQHSPDGTAYLDLFTVIIRDLISAGIPSAILLPQPPCTFATPEYASFRRNGPPTASMIAWLCIR